MCLVLPLYRNVSLGQPTRVSPLLARPSPYAGHSGRRCNSSSSAGIAILGILMVFSFHSSPPIFCGHGGRCSQRPMLGRVGLKSTSSVGTTTPDIPMVFSLFSSSFMGGSNGEGYSLPPRTGRVGLPFRCCSSALQLTSSANFSSSNGSSRRHCSPAWRRLP